MNPGDVKPGDMLYVDTSDDITGGKATVREIKMSDHLPESHINYYMVIFKEFPWIEYNLRSLLEEQDELKKEFKDDKAHGDHEYLGIRIR